MILIIILNELPERNGDEVACGSHVAHNCALINGNEQAIYKAITATVCLIVFIFARDTTLWGADADNGPVLCHMVRHIQVYV